MSDVILSTDPEDSANMTIEQTADKISHSELESAKLISDINTLELDLLLRTIAEKVLRSESTDDIQVMVSDILKERANVAQMGIEYKDIHAALACVSLMNLLPLIRKVLRSQNITVHHEDIDLEKLIVANQRYYTALLQKPDVQTNPVVTTPSNYKNMLPSFSMELTPAQQSLVWLYLSVMHMADTAQYFKGEDTTSRPKYIPLSDQIVNDYNALKKENNESITPLVNLLLQIGKMVQKYQESV